MTRSLTRSQSARTMVRTYGFPSYARMGYVARELDATHYLRAVEWISSHEAASYPPAVLTPHPGDFFIQLWHRGLDFWSRMV
jgi:hypothetical protein